RRDHRVGALPLVLRRGPRRRPHPVADPRLGAVPGRDRARRARRAGRPAVGPADHAAADLRARAPDRARARGAAVALRARLGDVRTRADDRRARRPEDRSHRGTRGPEAMSSTVTRDSEGTVTGNTYDKYGSTNPVVRRLMAGFERTLD